MNISDNRPSSGPPLRVFLADDHAVVLAGLVNLLSTQNDMKVLGYASNGQSAVKKIECLQPPYGPGVDILITDIQMSPGNGTQTTAEVKRRWPQTRVVVLSMHDDRASLQSLLEAGVSGYVLKRSASARLISAIHAVHQGDIYLDPAFSPIMIDSLISKSMRGKVLGARLSISEEEVLRLVAQGHSNKEIAVRLKLSIKTIETQKSCSCQKLGISGRVAIMRYAMVQNWLENLA